MEYPSNSVWGMNGVDACYSEIEEIIGYQFTNRKLCRQAFIRKDYSAYKNIEGNNEVLEFYGDAVVYLFMSMYFLKGSEVKSDLETPFVSDMTLYDLSSFRNAQISNDSLARSFLKLGLDKFVLSEKAKHNAKFYGDTAEALIGSVWVDSGYNAEALLNVVSSFITFKKVEDTIKLGCLECLKHWHKVLYGKQIKIKQDNNSCTIEAVLGGGPKSYHCAGNDATTSVRKASFDAYRDMRRKLIRLFYSNIQLDNQEKTLTAMYKKKIISGLNETSRQKNSQEWISVVHCDEFRMECDGKSESKARNRAYKEVLRLLLNDAGIYPAGECKGIVLYRTFV